MANHKRAVPLTETERKARNRRYQQTRRERSNNGYARANRRALQRAGEWLREQHPSIWYRFMREELEREDERPYKPQDQCHHDGALVAVGIGTACEMCGKFMGVRHVDDEDRALLQEIEDQYDRSEESHGGA